MKKLLVVFMFTLYWPGTHTPIRIGDPVQIICDEYEGNNGKINYTWADGSVDIIDVNSARGIQYYHVRDLNCLRQDF